jgi:hypothetical protein
MQSMRHEMSVLKYCMVSLCLLFGGCSTGPDGKILPPPTEVVGNVVTQVQGVTRELCGFVPIAGTITSFFTSAGASVFDVANAICSALRSPANALASAAPRKSQLVTLHIRTPNGGVATVKGTFVGKEKKK